MSIPTTNATGAAVSLPASAEPRALDDFYKFTVDEYESLADAGVLKDRRVELINGWLVRKMTTKPPHVLAVDATREAIARNLPPGWWLREEKPVRIPEFDEPEPDISVVRGSRQDYATRHPGPGEIEFLVEVSDSSLAWDQNEKRDAYARAQVPTYWVLNLVDRRLEVFTLPVSGAYQKPEIFGPADRVPIIIAGTQTGWIAVADLFS